MKQLSTCGQVTDKKTNFMQKKGFKYGSFALLTIAMCFMVSCKKFSELAADPSKPSQGTPSLIFTGVITQAFNFNPILGYEIRASQYLVSDNSQQSDQAYLWSSTEFWGYYDVLRNVEQMRIAA